MFEVELVRNTVCTSSPNEDVAGEARYHTTTSYATTTTTIPESIITHGDDGQQEYHNNDDVLIGRISSSSSIEEEEEIDVSCCCQRDRAWYKKVIIGSILLAIICFVVIDSIFGRKDIRQGITIFLEWTKKNPGKGMIAFIFVYFIATVFCIPGSVLTLGSGFVFSASFDGSIIWGVCLGTIAVFIGAFASAIIAFLLGRYLFHDSVRRLSQQYKIFEALDIALAEKGLRIMCLLRLSPITPFVVLNYIAGVSTVRFDSYCLSNFAILPGTIFYVFLGASAGSLTDTMNTSNGSSNEDNKTVTIIVIVIGVTFGISAIALTSYYAKRELNKIVTNQEQQGVVLVEESEQCDDNEVEKNNASTAESEDSY